MIDVKNRLFQPGRTSAEQSLCPRLIDYIAIVGRRPNATIRRRRHPPSGQISVAGGGGAMAIPGGTVSHPELLRRYPSENHRDFELPRDVTYFCQPEGCVRFSGSAFRQLKKRNAFNEATFFVFTLTDKDSAKVRFGVTLNFFLNTASLSERRLHLPNGSVTTGQIESQHSHRPSSSHINNSNSSASLISLCMLSHHPFLSSFRDLLILFRQLVNCCNQRANQDETLPRDSVWTVLTGHWPQGMSIPNSVMQEVCQLETWLFALLSSPVPVPGKTKLLLEVLPADLMPNPMEFALPDHTRLSLVDFPLHLPLELLQVGAVLQILSAIMLEYKVILQSRNCNAVSVCVKALVALLYPLEYMFPVIPLLPAFMPSAEQLLLAPTPYIIGLPASFFPCKGIQVPSDVLLVDLDTNEICPPTDPTVHVPQMPQPEANNLKEEFLRALGRQKCENTGAEGPINIDGDKIDVACRVAMIHFYNGPNVFANFSEHTRTIRLYPRPVVALQVDSFLRSRPQQSEFIMELCKTQAVEYFAECSLCPANEAYVRVQAGVTEAAQIGDKAQWFTDTLMPVSFNAYPYGSSLAEAIFLARIESSQQLLDRTDSVGDGDDADYPTTATPSDLESVGSADAGGWSPFGSRSPLNLDISKPISDANDFFRAPHQLQLPKSESGLSVDSSELSSGRSSPYSTVDSEADFARLADNLALKRNAKGDFTFNHHTPIDEDSATICEESGERTLQRVSICSESDQSNLHPKQRPMVGQGERLGTALFARPLLMDALNGYAERGQGVFSQMMRKTAPKAQALKAKAKPLAEAVGNRMEASKVGQLIQQHRPIPIHVEKAEKEDRDSATTAQQQRKNQQHIIEICEQVIAGQGIGVFTLPKLNLGLEVRYAEDEFIQDVQLSRAQYKGYLKLLQACVSGLDASFHTPGSNGLASLFHVMEIAHTHFWTHKLEFQQQQQHGEQTTPGSESGGGGGLRSLLTTPSSSSQNLASTPSTSSNPTPTPFQIGNAVNGMPSPTDDQNFDAPQCEPPPLPLPTESPPLPPPQAPVYAIPAPNCPPPPLPARPPPPLPPRVPPRDVPPVLISTEMPPPVPKRPSLSMPAATVSEECENNNSSCSEEEYELTEPSQITPNALEITVKDQQFENAQEHNKKEAPKIQLLQQLNLNTLEAMLPSTSTVDEQVPPRNYLFKDLIGPPPNPASNVLWQQMTLWETAFLDMVAQERDKIGMDQEPAEMIDRYAQLGDGERKRLELEEDRILAVLLHNMTAIMHLSHVPVRIIQQKIRRLLGKAHIGLIYSKQINVLLDELSATSAGVKIPLKPLGSRLIQKEVFAVHTGSFPDGPMCFLEVCDDALILRDSNGVVQERWWYERLVNMTYSPKTRVLCLWRRLEDQVYMHKFHTKKCRHLYNSMKAAMERAASRGKVQVAGRELGGEFPIHDVERNEGGLLQVRIDGIALQFVNSQELIELGNIKKCNTIGGNIFILEEYNRAKNQLLQRRYISSVADQICYSVLCVFSFAAAHRQSGSTQQQKSTNHFQAEQIGLHI
uniref:MAP kinase-activating death domain protein n=1 Tax=Globodera rostochiensis TaxID=31243 RepID=A0A914HJY1_GLORO